MSFSIPEGVALLAGEPVVEDHVTNLQRTKLCLSQLKNGPVCAQPVPVPEIIHGRLAPRKRVDDFINGLDFHERNTNTIHPDKRGAF